jgi:hypothetical protein
MSTKLQNTIPQTCRVEYKNKVYVVDARDNWTNRVYLLGIGWVPATHVTRTKRPVNELPSIQALIARTIRDHRQTTSTPTTWTTTNTPTFTDDYLATWTISQG